MILKRVFRHLQPRFFHETNNLGGTHCLLHFEQESYSYNINFLPIKFRIQLVRYIDLNINVKTYLEYFANKSNSFLN